MFFFTLKLSIYFRSNINPNTDNFVFSANNSTEIFESFDSLNPAALIANIDNTTVCGRNPIMGTIVTDSAPYLYPFIIEYSLIGAAVIYVMWKHIGRYPR